LLTFTAGVAIMALGTVASRPDCNLKIIPVGMNYFHAHKFRSRAVIEFGTAIDVPAELAQKFDGPGRRDAIAEMLENVRQGLISVTVTTPDYDTLMVRIKTSIILQELICVQGHPSCSQALQLQRNETPTTQSS
jgi:glycerol-3-phosphate O-acyltransferase/dihydroxyacetone phosphate acyltransferase